MHKQQMENMFVYMVIRPTHYESIYKLLFGGNLYPLQEEFNSQTSKVRISVERLVSEIIKYFAFRDFKKNLKVGLSPVGKMHRVCTLLTNARTFLYKTQTSEFFNIDPPTLEEYFT